jgi:hypothetical protein
VSLGIYIDGDVRGLKSRGSQPGEFLHSVDLHSLIGGHERLFLKRFAFLLKSTGGSSFDLSMLTLFTLEAALATDEAALLTALPIAEEKL